MPCYNASKYIGKSIDSILNQNYTALELLITDDNSSDPETLRILHQYEQQDPRVRVFYLKENGGPGVARNNSIREARGRYIAFCDSDDRWFPDKLEKQIAYMTKRQCALCFSSYLRCDVTGKHKGIVIAPSRITLTELKHDNKIGCLTAIYDTLPYGKFYMPTIRKRQDWALFLTIMKKCRVAYGMVEPLAYYRKTPDSISRKKITLLKYNAQVYQHVFGYSVLTSYLYLFLVFLPTYFVKKGSNLIANAWR